MLNAIHSGMGQKFLALVLEDAPPQWQTDVVTSHFPALLHTNTCVPVPQLERSAQSQPLNSTAVVAHASVALHGLLASGESASIHVLSFARSLASLLKLISAVLASPGVMHHVNQDALGKMVAALYQTTPAVLGHASRQAGALLSAIRQHDEALTQKAEEQQSDQYQAFMLQVCMTWEVRFSLIGVAVAP